MVETIGDILSNSGNFAEAVQQATTQLTTPPPAQETAPAQEVKTEQVAAPEVKTEPVAPQAPQVDPSVELLKRFGYDNEDDLKSSLTELNTFKQKESFYRELEQQYEELAKKEDPLSLFANEEEYKNFLTAQKMGVNQGKDFGVVQKIVRTNMDQMDDLDVLSLKDQYDIPKFAGKDDKVKKALLEEIGVDVNDENFKLDHYKEHLTEEQDLKLARLANQARQFFNQNKADVKIPERVDYKQKIQERLQQRQDRFNQLNTAWKEQANRIAESSNQVKYVEKNEKGEVVDEFVYDVDAEFKQSIPEIVNNYAVTNNVEPTPENVKAVTELMMNAYKVANWEKMLKSARNEARTQVREQLDKERFNGQPINKTEAPPDRKPDETDEIRLIASKLFK